MKKKLIRLVYYGGFLISKTFPRTTRQVLSKCSASLFTCKNFDWLISGERRRKGLARSFLFKIIEGFCKLHPECLQPSDKKCLFSSPHDSWKSLGSGLLRAGSSKIGRIGQWLWTTPPCYSCYGLSVFTYSHRLYRGFRVSEFHFRFDWSSCVPSRSKFLFISYLSYMYHFVTYSDWSCIKTGWNRRIVSSLDQPRFCALISKVLSWSLSDLNP